MKIATRIRVAGAGLALAISGIAGISASALTQTSSANDPSTYIAALHPLNRSGVTGFAKLSLNSMQPGAALTASVNARGAEPNQTHAMHIHGKLDGGNAECPLTTADINNDRLVSVFEGAPFYGPIKVNLTSPATEFAPPSRTDLFAPFAGVPIPGNFPRSSSNGKINYNQTIPFDSANSYAVAALNSLTPLNDQHIVLHGGYAPESVDTPGGNPNKIVYDALLPVACGQIIQTHRGSAGSKAHNTNDNDNNGNNNSAASINNTGPGSNNSITSTTTNKVNVANTNDTQVSSRNQQASSTGSASAAHNTESGTAISGNGANKSRSSLLLRLMNFNIQH